jgi:hypothetical protein
MVINLLFVATGLICEVIEQTIKAGGTIRWTEEE